MPATRFIDWRRILTVELEGGTPGHRFPRLMGIRLGGSDPWEIAPSDVSALRAEVEGIQSETAQHRYPVLCWDEDPDLRWPRVYGPDLQVQPTHSADGWSLGVDGDGRVFVRQEATGAEAVSERWTWDAQRLEYLGVSGDASGGDSERIPADQPIFGVRELAVQWISLEELYRDLLEGLLQACDASERTGNPIEVA